MIEIGEETFRLRGPAEAFPREIVEDPWVLYHGTSSLHEARIEAEGLRPGSSTFTKAELSSVLEVFERMNWSGRSHGSRAVLQPYSVNYDFNQERGKPVFLTEQSGRAARYASKGCAGGEIAMTLRCCFDELDEYLHDSGVREGHKADMRLDWDDAMSTGRLPRPPAPMEADLDELTASLEGLRSVRERAEAALLEYQYGIVYAVRIAREALPGLGGNPSMGVMAFAPLLPDTLIAKVRVPADYVWHPDDTDPLVLLARLNTGVLEAIRRAG